MSELRQTLDDVLSQTEHARERLLIVDHGRSIAAIASLEDLELLRAIEDRLDGEAALEARREAEQLRYISSEQVRAGESG